MRFVVVAGARPNFMKVAPVLSALSRQGLEALLVHTGQHYDLEMSEAFFDDLALPEPNFYLGVGSASHAVQTARVMVAFEPVLEETRPTWLIVVGDVNSTLACALVAAKLRERLGCRIAHIEAGLRSADWTMPEELNRVLTDRVADLLLTPSRDARANLVREGIPESRICFVGNVMIDTLFSRLDAARERSAARRLGLEGGPYALVTLHRPSNVDDPHVLEAILAALARIGHEMPVLLPLHPRTAANVEAFGLEYLLAGVRTMGPLGYLDMLSLLDTSAVVLTDSGGLQEETTALGVPCITLREQTERPITITVGTNRLAPWPLTTEGIVSVLELALQAGRSALGSQCPEGWDGKAAERIVTALTAVSEGSARRSGREEAAMTLVGQDDGRP